MLEILARREGKGNKIPRPGQSAIWKIVVPFGPKNNLANGSSLRDSPFSSPLYSSHGTSTFLSPRFEKSRRKFVNYRNERKANEFNRSLLKMSGERGRYEERSNIKWTAIVRLIE